MSGQPQVLKSVRDKGESVRVHRFSQSGRQSHWRRCWCRCWLYVRAEPERAAWMLKALVCAVAATAERCFQALCPFLNLHIKAMTFARWMWNIYNNSVRVHFILGLCKINSSLVIYPSIHRTIFLSRCRQSSLVRRISAAKSLKLHLCLPSPFLQKATTHWFTSLPGLEPGASGLEVQRAIPLRHRDCDTIFSIKSGFMLPLPALCSILSIPQHQDRSHVDSNFLAR